MTLFSKGPDVVDIPRHIAGLLKPLQGEEFRCDEIATENIWRLLKRYRPDTFVYFNQSPEHHIERRGTQFVRKEEAAKLTHRVLTNVFGKTDFEQIKDMILGPTLCEARTMAGTVPISPEDLEKEKRFFKEWFREVQTLL